MTEIPAEVSKYMSELGKKGRLGKGKGGGRPRMRLRDMTPAQKKRREKYEKQLAKKKEGSI